MSRSIQGSNTNMDGGIPKDISRQVKFGCIATFYFEDTIEAQSARGGGIQMTADRHRFQRPIHHFENLYKQHARLGMYHLKYGHRREHIDT